MNLVTLVPLSMFLAATTALSAPMYFLNGKAVTPDVALKAAVDRQTVLACKPVEAKVSKSGTSIGLRQVKEKK